jgi:predicted transcriptional regulator of viral defense system
MRLNELNKISRRIFGYEDISRVFGITVDSARVAASRYTKQGLLVRIKRNLYMLKSVWDVMGVNEKLEIANLIQTPSYISLQTALSYYEISLQIQQNYFESISLKRSKEIEILNDTFNFTKIAPYLYTYFKKDNNAFIAEPEKAFVDAVYLMSLGRYKLDLSAIEFSRLNKERIKIILKSFPLKTSEYLERYERI